MQRLIDEANATRLPNLRFLATDAVTWLEECPDHSIDEILILHPQPYFNPAERGREMLTPEFVARCRAVLRKGGALVLQTDVSAFWRRLREAVADHFETEEVAAWVDPTRREMISRTKGMKVRRLLARPRG